jgi:hypothetical protein
MRIAAENGMRMAEHRMAEPGMGMSFAGRRKWEWQNTEWQPTPYCLNR